MVSINIVSSGKKLARAPDLPYTVAFPDPEKATIADVKSLLSVKFPRVSVDNHQGSFATLFPVIL
jgi:hypothetical protein